MTSSDIISRQPDVVKFESYAEQMKFSFFDLVSPSYWILEALKKCGVPDITETAVKPFTGNFDLVSQHAGGYKGLGDALVALSDELLVRDRAMTGPDAWEGVAASNFDTHMQEVAKEVRALGADLQAAGDSFQQASTELYNQYIFVCEILRFLFDLICDIVTALVNWGNVAKIPGKVLEGWKLGQKLYTWFQKLPATLKAFKALLKTKLASLSKASFLSYARLSSKVGIAGTRIGLNGVARYGSKLPGKLGTWAEGKGLSIAQNSIRLGTHIVGWTDDAARGSDLAKLGLKGGGWLFNLGKNIHSFNSMVTPGMKSVPQNSIQVGSPDSYQEPFNDDVSLNPTISAPGTPAPDTPAATMPGIGIPGSEIGTTRQVGN